MLRKPLLSKERKKKDSQYKPLVPAVDQACRVMVCLGRTPKGRMTLTEICLEVGIHKSKGFSILNTLRQFGFVEKDEQAKTYWLGPGLIFLARNVLDNLDIRNVVTPFLERIAVETKNTALFGLISAEQFIIVAKYEGGGNIGVTIRLGHRFHITSGCHGKTIAAFVSEGERKKILSRKKLYFYGDSKNMDMKRLEQEIEVCRKKGFAADIGELHPGMNAVSAPVFGPDGKITGCVVLIGTFLKRYAEKYGRKISLAAREISLSLGADTDYLNRSL